MYYLRNAFQNRALNYTKSDLGKNIIIKMYITIYIIRELIELSKEINGNIESL